MFPFLDVLGTPEEKNRLLILYECFHKQLFYKAYATTKSKEKAEDIVHETYVRAADYLNHIDESVFPILEQFLSEKKKTPALTLKQFAARQNDFSFLRVWGYLTAILRSIMVDDFAHTQHLKDVRNFSDSAIELENIPCSSSVEPEALLLQNESITVLTKAIRELNAPYKEILYLRYGQTLSHAEIGKILGKSEEAVRQTLHRARIKLREKLKEGGYYV